MTWWKSSSTSTTAPGSSANPARTAATSRAPNPAAGIICRTALSAGTAAPTVSAPSTSDQKVWRSLSESSTASHATAPGISGPRAQAAIVSVFPEPGPALTRVTGPAAPAVNMSASRGRCR